MVYKEWVEVPEEFKKFIWDAQEGRAPLECIILKVLLYGRFEDIKKLYEKYPEETFHVAMKYPEIKRGVKYWVKRWKRSGRTA